MSGRLRKGKENSGDDGIQSLTAFAVIVVAMAPCADNVLQVSCMCLTAFVYLRFGNHVNVGHKI